MGVCHICKSTLEDEVPYCPYCGERSEVCSEQNDYAYEAFISYRHLPLSSKLAKQIQRGLEGHRIPKGLYTQRSERKLGKLFRDEDELPASTSLSGQILEALKGSRFLIVVCTPETRESRWVEREIELFASLHGRDRILVALAEGERSRCLPDILLYRKTLSGDGTIIEEPTEPLAADFRPSSHKNRKNEMLRLVAALLGCGFDDLKQRERARRNALAARIVTGVLAVSMAFSAVVIFQHKQIQERSRQQQISQSRYRAREVDELLASGNRMRAIRVALDALPNDSTNKGRPFVPEACMALEKAVQAYPTEHVWLPLYSQSSELEIEDLAVNETAGTYATIREDESLSIYHLQDGHLLNTILLSDEYAEDPSGIDWNISSCGEGYLVVPRHGDTARFLNASTGETTWTYRMPEEICAYGASPDGTRMCLGAYDTSGGFSPCKGLLHLIDLTNGQYLSSTQAQSSNHSSLRVAIDETGSHICAAFGKDLLIADEKGNVILTSKIAQPYAYDIIWIGKMAVVVEVDEMGADFPCTIQAYSWEATDGARWSYETTMGTIASNGRGFSPSAEFFGSYEMSDGSRHAICGIGNTLLLVEVSSGTVEPIGEYDSPICETSQVKGRGGAWLRVCTVYDGVNEEVLEGRILGQERSEIKLDPPSIASFATSQGRDYLLTAPFDDSSGRHSVCVYQLAMPLDQRLAGPTESALSFRSDDAREPTKRERSIIDEVMTKNGLEWSSGGYAAVSKDGDHAIVQESGAVFSINIARKELCGMTEGYYEAFVDGGFTSDDCLFYAKCSTKDYLGSEKLYVFDLNEERFEARSAITYGSALSSDGKTVLIETSSTSYTLPYLSPEELIAQGERLLDESEAG